jgi:hypothetical protein
MGLFSVAKLFGMTIRESATDGSDFTNPDADYRRLFLGEDGQLHLKDSAGAVTDLAVTEITDLPTAEMDDSLVLAPDGAGGVEFRAETGGGVATDAIWDAAGDLAVGSGPDAAEKLGVGADSTVLTISASTHVPVWAAPAAVAFSGCVAYHNTTQTISNSWTVVALNSEDFDTDTYHDNSTNNSRLTVPTTGYYALRGASLFTNATGYLSFRMDGTTTIRGSQGAVGNAGYSANMTAIAYIASGHYVELMAYQGASSNIGSSTDAGCMTTFSIVRLG